MLRTLKGEVNPVACSLLVGGRGFGCIVIGVGEASGYMNVFWRWGVDILDDPWNGGLPMTYIHVACILGGRLCSLLYKVVLINSRSE